MALTTLYRAAVGPVGADYYLPLLTRFEKVGRAGLSWNSAASLYTLNWLLFRGMWAIALAYAGLGLITPVLLLGLGRLMFQWADPLELNLILAYLALLFVLPGLFGNALFYAKCRRDMAAALSASDTLNDACGWLNQRASSRQRFVRLGVLNALTGAGALLVYLWTTGTPVPGSQALAAVPASAPASAPAQVFSLPAKAAAAPVTEHVTQADTAAASGASSPAVVTLVLAASVPASVATGPMSIPVTFAASLPALSAINPASAASATPAMATQSVATSTPIAPTPSSAAKASEPVAALPPARVLVLKPASKMPKAQPAKTVKTFYINVGLFADVHNANNAHAKLLAAGLPAFKQETSANNLAVTRVRVGPFSNRAQALATIKKIHALKLDATLASP
jgi:cell division septation protein DedD